VLCFVWGWAPSRGSFFLYAFIFLCGQVEMRELMSGARLEFLGKTDRVMEHLESLQTSKDRLQKQVFNERVGHALIICSRKTYPCGWHTMP
jgi:hypothetical protein